MGTQGVTIRSLRRPNLHAYIPVLQMVLDIGPYEEHSFLPPEVPHHFADNQAEAFRVAWERLRPGDRLVAIADEVEHTLEHLYAMGADRNEDGVCAMPIALEVAVG